jgi:hypothetical protein
MRLLEVKQGLGLTIFDIDDTLFHTTAQIKVMKNGQVVRSLTNQEFNNYELQPGEEYDFGEFRSAEKFNKESQPIRPMIAKLKAILNNAGDSRVIMLTARADFDDKEKFLSTFKKYGIDMSRVHVHRAGNLPGDENPAYKKAVWVRKYLNTGKYNRVRLYDDSKTNLTVFKALEKEYPNVKFEAYYVGPEGQTTVHEAEADTLHSDEIKRQLTAAGYKELGTGADASVWAKDSSYVIKILMPEDAGSRAEETFRKFYEFCQEHQDLECLPKFNEVNVIDIQGKDYTQIDMERLIPLKSRSFNEGLVYLLSDYATKKMPWEQVKQALSQPKTWHDTEYFSKSANQFALKISSLNKLNDAKLAVLYNVMTLLYHTGRINKMGWDLHTENAMQREDGTIVITDPWFNMESEQ